MLCISFTRIVNLLLLLSAANVLAGPLASRGPRIVHEKRSPHAAATWQKHRRVDARTPVPIRVGLKQRNIHEIEDLLYSVSDPESPKYGQHWEYHEIAQHFAPEDETIAAVKEWLAEEGFGPERVRLTSTKGWIEIDATFGEAERLLDTEYHVYRHDDGSEHVGCDEYSVPAHVRHHVDLVTPTVNVMRKRTSSDNPRRSLSKGGIVRGPKTNGKKVAAAALPTDLSTCDTMITPDCLRALYNINMSPTETAVNTFAIVEFTPQSYVQSDLNMFFANFSPSQVGTTPILVSIDGGEPTATVENSFDINGESDLDFVHQEIG
ncbi:hypothetical protein SISSUDRAFT_1060362 [Sistotremastrum suecicum HHB10207 ss-3]|uniref:Peptidase S53 activation domain-containing protein n=1 Tax=Sistotremastrum suecicum HHB10207 ss-3 TaxID=1314776 RepID=A0A166F530_9AGAM|nr:hypothetical protein SISSUDRAFT_1060362 [Sistotremastrum suecicum HHB10207 ss-3]